MKKCDEGVLEVRLGAFLKYMMPYSLILSHSEVYDALSLSLFYIHQ